MMRFSPLNTTIPTHVAADTGRAEGQQTVAEIVTFRLTGTADPQAFAAAAKEMTPFLRETGAVLSRTLSVDASGLWTDHVTWTSMEAAISAAARIMSVPAAAGFMAMIEPSTVEMRHAPIRFSLQME